MLEGIPYSLVGLKMDKCSFRELYYDCKGAKYEVHCRVIQGVRTRG